MQLQKLLLIIILFVHCFTIARLFSKDVHVQIRLQKDMHAQNINGQSSNSRLPSFDMLLH